MGRARPFIERRNRAAGASVDPAGARRLVTVDSVSPDGRLDSHSSPNRALKLTGEARNQLERIDEASLTSSDTEIHAKQAQAIHPARFAHAEMPTSFSCRDRCQTGATVLARLRALRYDWRREVSAVRVPTLVIHGALDPLPVETSQSSSPSFRTRNMS
jgi:pimeloyl-ACP methyl ester carboxylesterase